MRCCARFGSSISARACPAPSCSVTTDEPAAGLSPAERVVMAETIAALPRSLTLLLIEHDIDLALRLVDNVTCMHNGSVLVEGTPDAIRADARVQEVYLGKRHHA